MSTALERVIDASREASLLEATASILGWDQETMMPVGGIELRSKQLAQLARMRHELFTSKAMGDLIAAAEGAVAKDLSLIDI